MGWKKGRLHTEEEKAKIGESVSRALTGRKLSLEHRNKLSEIKKRMFADGILKIPNNLGRKHSQETREKLGKIREGWKMPESGKEKLRKRVPWNKGLNKENNLIIKESSKKISFNNSRYWLNKKLPPHVVVLMSERGKKFVGEHNPSWIDGRSFEPYTKEFDKHFKFKIRERDGFMCLRCFLTEEEHHKLYSCNLHVHHIDYNKKNTTESNCCCLCSKCNSEVNFDRSYWTNFFHSLISERYNYQLMPLQAIPNKQ